MEEKVKLSNSAKDELCKCEEKMNSLIDLYGMIENIEGNTLFSALEFMEVFQKELIDMLKDLNQKIDDKNIDFIKKI